MPANGLTGAGMMDAHTILSSDKRYYASKGLQNTTEHDRRNVSQDVPDDINTNGRTNIFNGMVILCPPGLYDAAF